MDRQWILALFKKGYDTYDIAKLAGVDESVVYNALSL